MILEENRGACLCDVAIGTDLLIEDVINTNHNRKQYKLDIIKIKSLYLSKTPLRR